MKKIEAIIRPSKVDPVRKALRMRGVETFELFEAAGYGSEPRPVVAYRGALHVVPSIPRIKLEVVVSDALAMPLLYDIVDAARTGRIGDGHVLVSPVEAVVRIQTGEHLAETIVLPRRAASA